MIGPLLLFAACLRPAAAPPADSVAALYQSGKTWRQFFDAAHSRKETWRSNYDRGAPDSAVMARTRAVGGAWRVLVVAEDWCGDSANTVPYLVRLVEQVPSIELRIVNSTAGRWLMERHRTPDGRAATPTIVLLGADDQERGCFIEQPAAWLSWAAEHGKKRGSDDFHDAKMAWYRDDRGRSTVAEFVAMLEAAAGGSVQCGGDGG